MKKFLLSFILVFSFVFLLSFNCFAYSGSDVTSNTTNSVVFSLMSYFPEFNRFSFVSVNLTPFSYSGPASNSAPILSNLPTINGKVAGRSTWAVSYNGFYYGVANYFYPNDLGVFDSDYSLNFASTSSAQELNDFIIDIIISGGLPSFDPEQNINDVGYFKNMQNYFKVLTETSSSGNQQIVKKRSLSFGWDSTTTTGLSFDSESLYNARFEADLYKRTIFGKGDFIKTSTVERSGFASHLSAIIPMEGLPAFQSGTLYQSFKDDSGYDGDIVFVLKSAYFQPVLKINNVMTSGGWTRIQITGDWSTIVTGGMNTDAVQGNINDGGSFSIDSSASGGGSGTGIASSGTSLDEALQNQNSTIQNLINNTNVDTSNLTQTLTNLVGEVRAVPHILSSIFSWLPPWCLQLVASIFGVLFVIILLKVVIL